MPDKYDEYREALVIETSTIWPDQYDSWEASEKERIAQLLHENPQDAAHLEYVRVHTGFCRTITVTDEDVQRLT